MREVLGSSKKTEVIRNNEFKYDFARFGAFGIAYRPQARYKYDSFDSSKTSLGYPTL